MVGEVVTLLVSSLETEISVIFAQTLIFIYSKKALAAKREGTMRRISKSIEFNLLECRKPFDASY